MISNLPKLITIYIYLLAVAWTSSSDSISFTRKVIINYQDQQLENTEQNLKELIN